MKSMIKKSLFWIALVGMVACFYVACSPPTTQDLEKITSVDGGIHKEDQNKENKSETTQEQKREATQEKQPEAIQEQKREVTQEKQPENCACQEGQTQACYSGPKGTQGVGECKAGLMACVQCNWSACVGQVTPQEKDACSGKDENCNGRTDENCPGCVVGSVAECGTNRGVCKRGTQTCERYGWSKCSGEIRASIETCDGKDNNCDGQIDENFNVGTACQTGSGSCVSKGTFQCKADQSGTECNAPKSSGTTEICDGKDNDCDGVVDNVGTISCGIGACKKYVQACLNGKDNVCTPNATSKEICDGIDNDCNGQIDEGSVCVAPTKGKVFRVNSFSIAGSNQGFDLNGDKKIDNSLASLGTFVNSTLSTAVSNGSFNFLIELASLSDPTAKTGTATVYVYTGQKSGNGYTIDKSSLDANQKPLFRFAGNITSSLLTGGPSNITLDIPLFGTPLPIYMEKAHIQFQIAANLQSLQNGVLGGAIPASELDKIPADQIPFLGGPGKTLLDVLVGIGKQPDIDLDGDGLETFVAGFSGITSCKDGTGTTISGTTCAQNAKIKDAYSAAFLFTATPTTVNPLTP